MINPELHAWWHILCGVALYESFVLAAALFKFNRDVEENEEIVLPLLHVGVFGLDYLNVTNNVKQQKSL